ncbi:alkaline phosphatase family protein [Coriobacteriia bacterium Es71-Z0120]|uniref:alkaline phosphatase family protein n=1 Tax=Parvivirga hydrogeniphila TaxID=2939460 RepID=UPI002260998E|nr:alkaline phosphatase family protein [Parvivirga hydrogeniphila]MCL4078280.1 alkaline phosphatase family protein [Parvivirga hydrogeniphila]
MTRAGDSSLPIVLVVLDGLGDRPHAELDGRTPAEAANTPNLDALARLGRCGSLHPLRPGLAPSSHQAHFALFGYAPEDFPGRGLLEAIGEGLPPDAGEVVLRANLARVSERNGVLWIDERPDPRHGAADLDGVSLDARIDGVAVRFVYTGGLQGLLYLRPLDGRPISHFVSDADPLRANVPVLKVMPLEEAPDPDAAARTAAVLNAWMRFARRILAGRDLDFMLVKWAGSQPSITPFSRRFGLKGVSLGAGVLYAGLAAAVGLDHVEIPMRADPHEDVAERVEATLGLLAEGYDFVHLHTKHPDHAGHTKDPRHKAEVIAACDRALAPLVHVAERFEAVVVVCADHQTPSAGPLYHGGGAVPLVIAGGVIGADEVAAFGEEPCAHGSLGWVVGTDVMPIALDAADRSAFLADRVTPHLALGRPRAEDLVPLEPADEG